jgi:hypothetical protein
MPASVNLSAAKSARAHVAANSSKLAKKRIIT